WRAASTASRRSATPEVTAASLRNTAPDCSASTIARVVLPVPGGPHRIIECSTCAATIWLRNFPGPSRCSWPTISSSVRGRIRSASGWPSGVRDGNRLCDESALRRAIFEKYHSRRVRLRRLLPLSPRRCARGSLYLARYFTGEAAGRVRPVGEGSVAHLIPCRCVVAQVVRLI